MSNYPPGNMYFGSEESVKHVCPKCGHEWHADMFHELGGWFYNNDDDAFCPECGEEGTCD